MELSVYEVIGLCGFAAYLGGFAALQFGWLSGDGVAYTLANIIAAALVLTSLVESFNLASAMIQVSWIIIGAVGLLMRHAPRGPRRDP